MEGRGEAPSLRSFGEGERLLALGDGVDCRVDAGEQSEFFSFSPAFPFPFPFPIISQS